MPTRQEKIKILEERRKKQQQAAISSMSRDEKIQALSFIREKQNQDPEISASDALRIGLESGFSLGFRPAIAGAGAAIGAGIGAIQRGAGLSEVLQAGKGAFFEGRKQAREEEEAAMRDQPAASIGGQIAGGVATLPFTAVRSLKGAAALGGVIGAGKAASEAESLSEVPGEIAKGVTVGLVTDVGLRVAGKASRFVGDLKAVQKVKNAVKDAFKSAGESAKGAFTRVGEAATGVPKEQIKTLIDQGDEVAKLIKKSGGDLTGEADAIRRRLTDGIQRTRSKASKQITKAIEAAPDTKVIDASSPLKSIKNVVDGLDPVVNRKDIKAINELVAGEISKASSKDGGLSLKSAQALKKAFDDMSKDTYVSGGKIFTNTAGVKRAAKAASSSLRSAIKELSPEIAEANKTLSDLRNIEKVINKNLLAEGKSDAALFAAGSDTNKRNAAILRRLGEITGTKPLEESKKLATARTFSKAKLLTTDTTGKGFERGGKAAILGGAAGAAVGGVTGGAIGAGLATLATSPAALRSAISGGKLGVKAAKQIYKSATPKVKSILIQQFGRQNFE